VEGAHGRREVSERLLVMTTVARAEDAEYLAREVVERRLAACVNLLPPITSVYRWHGDVTREEERMLLMKTRADRFAALRDLLLEIHPYEVPEVIAVPLEAGSDGYLKWLDDQLG
jgi:periplasmic divalent cation tolerance protein